MISTSTICPSCKTPANFTYNNFYKNYNFNHCQIVILVYRNSVNLYFDNYCYYITTYKSSAEYKLFYNMELIPIVTDFPIDIFNLNSIISKFNKLIPFQ